MDVFRLNMSHCSVDGTQEQAFLQAYNDKRHEWERQGRHVAIMGDLQGPKIRIGYFHNDEEASVKLEPNKDFTLHTKKKVIGDDKQATVVLHDDNPFAGLAELVEEGDRIWLGDGEILLDVAEVSCHDGRIRCRIRRGGEIKGRRGVTVEGKPFNLDAFTKKDEADLGTLLAFFGGDLTYIALSFVKSAEDILNARYFIEQKFRTEQVREEDIPIKMPGLIAKIETQEAVDNIDEILDMADGIMVARGDLGMQIGLEKVAGIQKRIIYKCNLRGKPVITATQMLDSMERNPVPTRAEVADVYNAILDGTDAVMLSGETSAGTYPLQAICIMRRVAEEAEEDFFKLTDLEDRFFKLLQEIKCILPEVKKRVHEKAQEHQDPTEVDRWCKGGYDKVEQLLGTQETTDRISHAACSLSIGAKAIIAPTTSGQTTRMVARFRPDVPIIGVAHDDCVARKLILCFGVYPLNITRQYKDAEYQTNEEVFEMACKKAKETVRPPLPSEEAQEQTEGKPLLASGDFVVITAGYPLFKPGTTNLVKLHKVDNEQ